MAEQRRRRSQQGSAEGEQPGSPMAANQIKVRQVTDIQASWTETERGEEGLFTLQLILDNGVDEYILQPDSDDLEPMLKLFRMSDYTTFDLERKVLMFSTLKTKK